MILAKLLVQQLSNPSGVIAKLAGPLWNKRNAALNDLALASLALNPADRVLEVGFGGGYLLGRMSAVVTQGFLAGVDISPALVNLCQNRYRPLVQEGKLDLKCGRAELLPYPSEHFGKVCSVNSIFYWQDVRRALAEFERVLIQGGALVICFTCKASLQKRSFARYIGLYEVDEIQAMLATCGFTEIQTRFSSDKHREFVCITSRK